MRKDYFIMLTIMLAAFWLGSSIAVDVVAIPAVFKTIKDVVLAGKVGMVVFSRFNKIEMIVSSLSLMFVMVAIFREFKKPNKQLFALLMSLLLLVIIAGIYTFSWTPLITQNAEKMFSLDVASDAYKQAAFDYNYYHKAYVKLEGVKLSLICLELFLLIKMKLDLSQNKSQEL